MRANIKRVKFVYGKDRLSDLHDDILVHILSFLDDPKSAAQTCVLSKRWNNKLWMHLPDLYLHSKTFGENSYEFEKFVDMVLTRRDSFNSKLRFFSFCWTFGSEIPQQLLDRVHSHAQSNDVQRFDLSIGCDSGCRSYPSQNFNPKSLTTLRLNLSNRDGIYIHTDYSLNLQDYLAGCTALKILCLETFRIKIKSAGDVDLFSSLINLTELRIVGCNIYGKDIHFHVRSPKLERLTLLENVNHMGREISGTAPIWEISTPLLKYLRLDIRLSMFSLCPLPSVEELEINIHTHINSRELWGGNSAMSVIHVIKGIPNVKSVTLSKSTLQVNHL